MLLSFNNWLRGYIVLNIDPPLQFSKEDYTLVEYLLFYKSVKLVSNFAASEIFQGIKVKVHSFSPVCGSWINGLSAQGTFNCP